MRWVYILKCSDDYYYVGETKRLYRRFWEHQEGIGGINTTTYIPEGIVSIYKVSTLGKFFEYNNMVMNKNCNIYYTMITCNLMGGLGNQIFQIFTTLACAIKSGNVFVFTLEESIFLNTEGYKPSYVKYESVLNFVCAILV